MFTTLKDKLDRRLYIINQEKGTQEKISREIQNFLDSRGYPQAFISYNKESNQVCIETPSKVFSNEISLCLTDISKILKEIGITPKSIVIR